MESSIPGPKHDVRKFVREQVDKIFRRSSAPTPSRLSSHAPGVRAVSSDFLPADRHGFSSPSNAPIVVAVVAETHAPVLPSLSPVSTLSLPFPVTSEAPQQPSHATSPQSVSPGGSLTSQTSPIPRTHAYSQSEFPTTLKPPYADGVPSQDELPLNPASFIGPVPYSSSQPTIGAWRRLDTSLRDLKKCAELFPLVQSAIDAFLPCLDLMEASLFILEGSNNHEGYRELASEISRTAEHLTQYMSPSNTPRMSGSIANVACGIKEQATLIEGERKRGTGQRLLGTSFDGGLAKCYYRVASLFRQLEANLVRGEWGIADDQMEHVSLEKLVPAKLAYYDSDVSRGILRRRACTEGTRTSILSQLQDWSHNPDATSLYWINGIAGVGKTTIAYRFSEILETRHQLAASFFCTSTFPECRDVSRIIPTVAYQLGQYSIPFRWALYKALNDDPGACTRSIPRQFEQLLKAPLLNVREAIPGDLVVTIDGLDECDNTSEVKLLLYALFKSSSEVPLKFFVTSRTTPGLHCGFFAHNESCYVAMQLDEVEKSLTQADIGLYLKTELESTTLAPVYTEELALRSGGLFIYAATLVRYIQSPTAETGSQQRLELALTMTSHPTGRDPAIDGLYAYVIEEALKSKALEAQESRSVLRLLEALVCAREPIPIQTLAALAGLSKEHALIAIQLLHAVVHFSETAGLVSILHPSFPEFMLDKSRSGTFCCDIAARSGQISQYCFEVMESQLRFNICGLESSFFLDSQVRNLPGYVTCAVPPALWYACRHWADHLERSVHCQLLCKLLGDFLSNRLLFWMEVLNLKMEVGSGITMLLKAKQWLRAIITPIELTKIILDARNFILDFATTPVSQSTPHIYMSLLPFYPRSNSVFKHYYRKTKGLIDVVGSAMQRREDPELTRWWNDSRVYAVAHSPDGKVIASGCYDGAIYLRDALDGTLVTNPLRGHSLPVWSVAYSPDGIRIISGSYDKTIRVWDAYDGTLIAGPLEGHTSTVYSLSYLPVGTLFVSGSRDGTIRVWDAQDGTPIDIPFHGHTGPVRSVAYSPDGTHIVSGSRDSTIRVWNADDGTLAVGPFEGHAHSVNSVAYSFDGARIVSGSRDKTVRVWNAHDGQPVLNPLTGHASAVYSAAYSPDNTRIVSSSEDRTIRVWDALDGTLAAGPFNGHSDIVRSVVYSSDGTRVISGSNDKTTRVWNPRDGTSIVTLPDFQSDMVMSIAYSPDGTRIVSGTWDDCIQIWDARDGKPITTPFEDYTSPVYSVSYSHDGSRIVSGSGDKTIRVWDAQNGTLIAGPFEGHTSWVNSAVYSPDGTYIVSGSRDTTIRVWDAHDGTPITKPLEGHAGPVYSVACSPDGARIASGSYDNTIRLWDARDGTPVAAPFKGHTGSVNSVAYSPDGAHIASGSGDKTIIVWKVNDGTPAASPFQGHTHSIESVSYSPDGTRIASGSKDKTIRLWNASNGELVARPFEGHTHPVKAIAFSPNGTRIVSGSSDSSIRVWKAHDDLYTAPSPEGSTECANAARDDGWVTRTDGTLLFWVPPVLRFARLTPGGRCVLVIDGYNGTLVLDYGSMLFGERWVQCYNHNLG